MRQGPVGVLEVWDHTFPRRLQRPQRVAAAATP